MTVETLIKEFHQLPEEDKLRFLESIPPFDESLDNLSEEWIAEIKNRWISYKTGEVKAIDGNDLEKRLMEEYDIRL